MSSESDEAVVVPWRRRAVYIALPLLAFAALQVAIEGTVRLTTPHLDSLDVFVRSAPELENLADDENARIFTGDPLLFWRLAPDLDRVIWDYTLVSTNSQGLRHDRDVGGRPRNGLRILSLGDSVTFGFRVPVVWADRPDDYQRDWKPYPQLLEQWLAAANPGREVEVISLAVPGYSTHQGLAWLRRVIRRFDPDIVTICFAWNDVTRRQVADHQAMPTEDWSSQRRALIPGWNIPELDERQLGIPIATQRRAIYRSTS